MNRYKIFDSANNYKFDVYSYTDTIDTYINSMIEWYDMDISRAELAKHGDKMPAGGYISFYDCEIDMQNEIDARDIIAVEIPTKKGDHFVIVNNDLLFFICEKFEVITC